MPKEKGLFVTFEGIEGSGKSTQIDLLHHFLSEKGLSVVRTLEPGGTPTGQALRALLLDPKTRLNNPLTELFLFTADRLEHLSSIILPALANQQIVLCDRYIDSTRAYQKGGRQLPEDLVTACTQVTARVPDLTFLFDLSPEIALKRAKNRAELDRFEQESIDFHARIRAEYLRIAETSKDRVIVLSCESMIAEDVFELVKEKMIGVLGLEV